MPVRPSATPPAKAAFSSEAQWPARRKRQRELAAGRSGPHEIELEEIVGQGVEASCERGESTGQESRPRF